MPVCTKCGFTNPGGEEKCVNCAFPLLEIGAGADGDGGAGGSGIKARKWNIIAWYEQHRRWEQLPRAAAHASVTPGVAGAAEPNTWTIRLEPEEPLEAGAHVALELSLFWKMDLGRPFYPRHVNDLSVIGEGSPGYTSFLSVWSSNPEAVLDVAISYCSRADVIDVAIIEGALQPGDSLDIVLGDPESSKFRAPKHAQRAVLAMGIDADGSGTYRGLPEMPAVDVVGGRAASLKVTAPAVVEPGESFLVHVLATDRHNENPATGYEGRVDLMVAGDLETESQSIVLQAEDAGKSATCSVDNPGVFRVVAVDKDRALAGRSNPIVCRASTEERLFFGEIHGQTYDSIGTGTLDEYFAWGRDVERLDFCASANHYGGRYEMGPELWQRVVDTSNRFYAPGEYVTFVSYEWHGLGGHKNVYYRGAEGQFYPGWDEAYDNPEKLWQAFDGQKVLTIPHHTKYGGMTDWEHRNDEYQRLVEICSGWGISEEGGVHSVQHALAMGYRLGFIGGTDTHIGQPAHGSFQVNEGRGLTAVYARDLTREAIWDGLRDRLCYATTGARIVLDFRGGSCRMGQEVSVESGDPTMNRRSFHATVVGTDELERVEVVRNNRVVHSCKCGSEKTELDWDDEEDLAATCLVPAFSYDRPFAFYYLRVVQKDRERAWSSPIWFNLA